MQAARRFLRAACSVVLAGSLAASAAAGELRVVDAARRDDVNAVRALLAAGVDVNARQNDGATALHWAAYHDNVEIAGLLLDGGATPNAANDLKVTPLFIAATGGSAAMVRRLVEAGADVNAANETHVTPLMAAARRGSVGGGPGPLHPGARGDERGAGGEQTPPVWGAARGGPGNGP